MTGEEFRTGETPDPIEGVVLANEVADALPVHRLVVRNGALVERFVVWDGEWFAERERVLSDPVRRVPDELADAGVPLVEGGRYDVSPAAGDWFATACAGLRRGYAIAIDYGYPAAELYRRHRLEGTVRGYAAHTVNDEPFARIGRQDLTAHVDFTALRRAGERAGLTLAGLTTQGALLASLGLGERLLALQRDPTTTLPDYAAAQAVVLRLIDPGGLGRFGVLIMARAAPIDPPLLGLATKPPPF